jgi:serine O-acetyltransferase
MPARMLSAVASRRPHGADGLNPVTKLRTTLESEALCRLAARQLDSFFGDDDPVPANGLLPSAKRAMARLEHCFAQVNNRYFFDGRQAVFDHLHGDQYAMWLYLLSNQLYRDDAPAAWCKKVFLLNKALHGCDIFYEVELPSVFLLVHPLGTVLGRGQYSDHFIAYQRVGIGSNHDVYPTLGRHVTLRPGSAVLGRSVIGDNCSVATESLVLDQHLPPGSVYIGNPRDHIIRPQTHIQPIWRS